MPRHGLLVAAPVVTCRAGAFPIKDSDQPTGAGRTLPPTPFGEHDPKVRQMHQPEQRLNEFEPSQNDAVALVPLQNSPARGSRLSTWIPFRLNARAETALPTEGSRPAALSVCATVSTMIEK
jgi:hypothetical protein